MCTPTTHDPYADVAVQPEPSRRYTIAPLQTINLIIWIILTTIAALGSRSPWAALGLIPIAYSALTLHNAITCDEEGLIIHYWLIPPRRVLWANIRLAQVSVGRGLAVCVLTLTGIRLWANVNFRVADYRSWRPAWGGADILFKTITVRASLTDCYRVPVLGGLYYRRPKPS